MTVGVGFLSTSWRVRGVPHPLISKCRKAFADFHKSCYWWVLGKNNVGEHPASMQGVNSSYTDGAEACVHCGG
ncbi:MAG: hypothetical protein ACYCVM_06875, partial [Acidiferrobacter sp.]